MSVSEAQELYDRLLDKKKKLARTATRNINNNGVRVGDDLSPELLAMRDQMRLIDKQMAFLLENYPGVLA